jgi:hypothetical protein
MKLSRRLIANSIAIAALILGYLIIFVQVFPIPQAMALEMPYGLVCEFYGASRYKGWHCTRLGDVVSQPMPTVLALSMIAISTFVLWARNGPLAGNPLSVLFAVQPILPFGAGAITRVTYFLQGHASTAYATWTLFPLIICVGGALLAWLFRFGEPPPSFEEKARRAKVGQSAAIEATERLTALHNVRNDEPD